MRNACHRAHGPGGVATPPTCTTCHPQDRLPNLHRVAEHGNCGGCHQAHEKAPRSDKQACLSCHKDMKEHEPQAKSCIGCHVFRR